jgi:hypothetical protein
MARNDIRLWSAPRGGGDNVSAFPLAASQTFAEGDLVIFDGAGALTIAATDPQVVAGIAAERATDVDGASRAAGTLLSVYQPVDSQLWVCNNFATDGAATPATPTQANAVGLAAGFILDGSGNWFVDTGSGNAPVQIEYVLDGSGRSVTDPNTNPGAGTAVVFRFA